MDAYIKEFNVGTERPYSSEYRRVTRNLKSRKAARKLGLTPTDMLSEKFMRIRYVRYADAFIIGLICSKTKTLEIKNHIKMFLKEQLHLKLSNSKTLLTDVVPRKHFNYTSHVGFLGYLISMHKGVITRTIKNRRRLTGKNHVVLKVDQRKVVSRLAKKGFCTKDGSPRSKFTYIHDTQAVTNEKVNRIFRGIVSYYIPKPVKAPLNTDFLSSFNEVYNGQLKEVEVIQELLRKHTIAGPIQVNTLACIDCGSQEDVNLHHTKSLALTDDLKKKILAKSLRKVVSVYKNCHLNRHSGSFRQSKK